MAIEIRPITPDLAETFVGLFDRLDFEHERAWKSCYCRYYYIDCTFDQWKERTGADNRADAIAAIRAGRMPGWVALEDGLCVGWVNAGESRNYPRLQKDLAPFVKDELIGLTICFVVDPGYRNRGLARRLLAGAIAGFRATGYAAAIALPVDLPMPGERRYRGSLHMYQEAGYRHVASMDIVQLWRLEL
ncbi:MAG: GNAT family N-acetyltransferase [bacterium]